MLIHLLMDSKRPHKVNLLFLVHRHTSIIYTELYIPDIANRGIHSSAYNHNAAQCILSGWFRVTRNCI